MVRPISPPLDAAYDENPTLPWVAAPEMTLMITPDPCCFIIGMTARDSTMGPVRFTLMTSSHSSSVRRVMALRREMAALLTRASMRPSSPLIRPTRAAMAPGSDMSPLMATELGMASAAARVSSSRRPLTMTRAPSAAQRSAAARPMPRVDPVISTTRSSSSPMGRP